MIESYGGYAYSLRINAQPGKGCQFIAQRGHLDARGSFSFMLMGDPAYVLHSISGRVTDKVKSACQKLGMQEWERLKASGKLATRVEISRGDIITHKNALYVATGSRDGVYGVPCVNLEGENREHKLSEFQTTGEKMDENDVREREANAKANYERVMAERRAKEAAAQAAAQAADAKLRTLAGSAAASIVAYQLYNADPYGDYGDFRPTNEHLIGFSSSSRNDMHELRGYAAAFAAHVGLDEYSENEERGRDFSLRISSKPGSGKGYWLIAKEDLRHPNKARAAVIAGNIADIKAPQAAQEPQQSKTDLVVVDYSDKAIAVFGNTRAHAQKLKSLGGKFAFGLTHNGRKEPGWIFSKARSEASVRAYVGNAEAPQGFDLDAFEADRIAQNIGA